MHSDSTNLDDEEVDWVLGGVLDGIEALDDATLSRGAGGRRGGGGRRRGRHVGELDVSEPVKILEAVCDNDGRQRGERGLYMPRSAYFGG